MITYTRWPKLGLICDCDTHLILGTLFSIGPHPDINQLNDTLDGLAINVVVDTMLADAGYDSESNHQDLRDCGIETVIPPNAGRPTDKLPKSKWRFMMAADFDEDTYGQRWQVETVMSMLKRNLGEALSCRGDERRDQEMMLMVLTHNMAIIYESRGFLQSSYR